MTCRCDTEWCWICGKVIDEDPIEDHFSANHPQFDSEDEEEFYEDSEYSTQAYSTHTEEILEHSTHSERLEYSTEYEEDY